MIEHLFLSNFCSICHVRKQLPNELGALNGGQTLDFNTSGAYIMAVSGPIWNLKPVLSCSHQALTTDK